MNKRLFIEKYSIISLISRHMIKFLTLLFHLIILFLNNKIIQHILKTDQYTFFLQNITYPLELY